MNITTLSYNRSAFELWTDHDTKVVGMANQKLEGMLGCWALALQ